MVRHERGKRVAAIALLLAGVAIGSGGCRKRPPTPPPVADADADAAPESNSAEKAAGQAAGHAAGHAAQTNSEQTAGPALTPSSENNSEARSRMEAENAARNRELAALDRQRLARASPPVESWRPSPASPASVGGVKFLLLTPQAPLVVELVILIGGEPLDRPLAELTEKILKLADADGDGRATWEELAAAGSIRSGAMGNTPIPEGQTARFVRRYDADQDGMVDPEEVPRMITRNSGGARPFSIRGANYYLDNNRLNSPLRRLLDDDRNGRIAPAEIERAAERMRALDADEDDILQFAELVADRETPPPPALDQRIASLPDAVAPLDGSLPWNRLVYALQERYGNNAPLTSDTFPAGCPVFAWLDVNGDGQLSRLDMASTADAAAPTNQDFCQLRSGQLPWDVRLVVRLGEPGREPIQEVQFAAAVRAAPQLTLRGQTAAWTTPEVGIQWFVRDAPQTDFAAQAETQLRPLDADANGYLELDELPEDSPLRAEFTGLDRDGDGKLFAAEWAVSLSSRAEAAASQVRARGGFQSDALYAALDVDHDGRLASRELDGAAARLRQLDAAGDGDGSVQTDEIPEAMIVGLVRGSAEEDGERFVPPPIRRVSDGPQPRWFVGMDRNRDGELSPREFLGTADQFQQLDTDQNGYLDAREAAASF